MDVGWGTWGVVLSVIVALIVLDLLTFSRKPHEVGFKEAAWWSLFYIGVAIVFGVWVWFDAGATHSTEYLQHIWWRNRFPWITSLSSPLFSGSLLCLRNTSKECSLLECCWRWCCERFSLQ
jgi:hypothetical protein